MLSISCVFSASVSAISLLVFNSFLISSSLLTEELVIGREKIDPGINLVFEAAPKDIVFPVESYLLEKETDIHIEVLANWSKDAPSGAPIGGFVAYLEVYANIISDKGDSLKMKLTPHLNMSDNLHYAQNIKLPGTIDELYDISFNIYPPLTNKIGIHYDWKEMIGEYIPESSFNYKNLNFKSIALSKRR